ncbi:DoxX family protein [Thermostaphylospora chromogena]|uniref:DoxX-like family protein n=1 Tax=Thermostaphylospora chromogena TaxID=35622 RepID=A0A1H1D3H6_9ACTN|nr:DoxX family protein [Thermostaphylospora chromogena]SDQ70994.1 DoxX-like family protein [Thermostaphylospora chromogena]
MNVVLWVVTGLLVLVFVIAGMMKLLQPKKALVSAGMAWAEDFPPAVIKGIGVLEVSAALGLLLPATLAVAPVLTPLAALGLALIMVGAIVVHARRREFPTIVVNLVLLVLAAVVAWGRFGPYGF